MVFKRINNIVGGAKGFYFRLLYELSRRQFIFCNKGVCLVVYFGGVIAFKRLIYAEKH